MARSTYMGQSMGFVQGTYFDQMGSALSGGIAYAADINLIDSGPCMDMPDNTLLQCGLAVSLIPASGSARLGGPAFGVTKLNVPTGVPFALQGITIRSQVVHTDAQLNSGWFEGDTATYLAGSRVGGRIWVKTFTAVTPASKVMAIVAATTAHNQPIGTFTGTAITGDTAEVTNAKYLTTATAGGLVLLELTA